MPPGELHKRCAYYSIPVWVCRAGPLCAPACVAKSRGMLLVSSGCVTDAECWWELLARLELWLRAERSPEVNSRSSWSHRMSEGKRHLCVTLTALTLTSRTQNLNCESIPEHRLNLPNRFQWAHEEWRPTCSCRSSIFSVLLSKSVGTHGTGVEELLTGTVWAKTKRTKFIIAEHLKYQKEG